MIRTYQGDCLEVMKTISDGSIDLTVTSPPYDNLREYKGYSFDFEGIACQLFRITKQGGVVVWVIGDATIKGSETGTSFRQALFFKEIGFNLHDTMIYKKISMPKNHKRYSQDFEYMFIFSKEKLSKFNALKVPCAYAGVKTSPSTRKKNGQLESQGSRIIKNEKIKSNIWKYEVCRDRICHPAVFPLQLAKDHIISWSNESDIVLDPFMGSGTTGAACVELNRSFIGIEIASEYHAIAQERIALVILERGTQ